MKPIAYLNITQEAIIKPEWEKFPEGTRAWIKGPSQETEHVGEGSRVRDSRPGTQHAAENNR